MPKVIGEVEQVALHAFAGQDIAFDLEWYEEDGVTKRKVSAVEGRIATPDDAELILDLALHATIKAAPDDHIVLVRVPAATVDALTHRSGVWYFALREVVSGEQKTVAMGPFKLFGRAS